MFFDAPLTTAGLEEAQEIAALLRDGGLDARDAAVLDGETGACLVASNLRRALQTCVVAFQGRVARGDVVHVASCLQEISTNVDTLSLAEP